MTEHGRDASDRLSPIIVKELRQGVRGHVFTGAFLLQVLLLLGVALMSAWLDTAPGNREGFMFLFWVVITLPLVIILPLGAGTSISEELRANTFEPLLLTRLTPWRLVAGKWAASASQAVVLAIAALPFVLVRYYLGAVEIVDDLLFLAAYACCSFLLASLAVALSPARLSALFRWGLMAGLGLAMAISFLGTVGEAVYSPMLVAAHSGSDVWSSVLVFAAVVLLVVLSALEASALQVAPAASARPLRLRLLALLALGAAAWSSQLPASDMSLVPIVWAMLLAGAATLAALCEPLHALRSRYAGFYRKRFLVPLAWFLAPGWPAGVGFVILIATAAAAAAARSRDLTAAGLVLGGLLGTLLLPLVVWRTFAPRARAFLLWLLVTMGSAAFSTIAPIAMAAPSKALWDIGSLLLPLCPAAYAMARLGWYGDYGTSPATTLPAHADAVFACFVSLVAAAALWHTVRAWRAIGRLVRQPA